VDENLYWITPVWPGQRNFDAAPDEWEHKSASRVERSSPESKRLAKVCRYRTELVSTSVSFGTDDPELGAMRA
jgi:hypothetical protein